VALVAPHSVLQGADSVWTREVSASGTRAESGTLEVSHSETLEFAAVPPAVAHSEAWVSYGTSVESGTLNAVLAAALTLVVESQMVVVDEGLYFPLAVAEPLAAESF